MSPLAIEPWQLLCGEVAPALIIDLRDPALFARGHLPGATNTPYHQLQAGPLPAQDPLLVDAAGARAAEMAVYLRGRGRPGACYLEGGMAAWTGPLARP